VGVTDQQVARFSALFDGLKVAFGTGKGEWIKRPQGPEDFRRHLDGEGAGIGIAPLRPDNTVRFAAIDLDEPDFVTAREMQDYIPGVSWLEKSRSGNAHVWVFFKEPLEAWVAMGVLKEATLAAGKQHVEVFPKNHDFSKVKLGNYINLPYHGESRHVMDYGTDPADEDFLSLDDFLNLAEHHASDPADWKKKARWLFINPPDQRERSAEFGSQRSLHMCAEYILEHAEDNPVLEGHRAAVYFALAKQLTNWQDVDHDEALMLMRSVNDASPDRIPDSELRRILGNAERGQFTSTGCDDPLVAPYAHPDCPIAHPRR
jgi:hypothetical protein